MKKYEFELNEPLYEKACLPIRTKQDMLQLLALSIKYLICTPINSVGSIPTEKKMILYVDKMSRLLFCVREKIFTFQFPLQVRTNPNDSNHIAITYSGFFDIDTIVSSLLIAIFTQEDLFAGSLESINDKISQELIENEWEEVDWETLLDLVKTLMLFEPGYLRYDHDIKNANGTLHPEHHLDFFFSSNSTMKLGLPGVVTSDWMLDMLNILTNCKYIR